MVMARPDVYEAAGGSQSRWEDYAIARLEEAGIEATKDAALALSAELTRIWLPETPHWNLDTVLKASVAEDRKALKAVTALFEEAKAGGHTLHYRQDGHVWAVDALKSGVKSEVPQARVLPSGRWFCFSSTEGFFVS